ncbi:MAG TPA: SH3 domain-containing protein [Microlunatus sp.]
MKRTILTAGAAVALATVGLGVTAGAASANTSTSSWGNSQITQTTGVHNAPSRQAPAVTTLNAGSSVQALCFIPDGDKVDGNTIWFRVAVDSRTGWVPKAVIGGVPSNLPGC